MNKEKHATPLPLVPVVSYDGSYYDYIGAPKVSEEEPLGNDGPSDRPIPPEPPPQKLSKGSTEGSKLEESPDGALQDVPYGNVIKKSLNKSKPSLKCFIH